jgi:DNA helicase-2/ATP-dependent DNA helicase PcrA
MSEPTESVLLKGLNPPQKEAVECLNGPLLILAGAGSGKTRVLTHRMANLILQGEASPSQILAVTFTNKAAKEMQERTHHILAKLGVPIYEDLWISTFHSSCARILRDQIHWLGYKNQFVIYDDSDQMSVLKKVCQEMNLSDKVFPPKALRHQISQAKMLGLLPHEVSKHRHLQMDQTAIEVYSNYESYLERANALDFDDLLLKTHQLFLKHPEILESYQERFKYIMVDEYQDTNHIQYLLIKILAKGHRNLCVVGDEDQSIYSWRGADMQNIMDFEKDFPEAKVIKLEENYRSTKTIVTAASAVIKNNSFRKDKTLFTNKDVGSKIVIHTETNEYEEARFVVHKIELLMGRYSANDIAVFYRTNAQSRVIEEQFRSYSIPYRIIGSVGFYDRKEVKDLVCYLRLILNPNDDVAFYRIVNSPVRGLGQTTLNIVLEKSQELKIPAIEAARAVAVGREIHAGACNKLQSFCSFIEDLHATQAQRDITSIYLDVIDKTQYVQKLKNENTPESDARVSNLEELQNAIAQFEAERGEEATLAAFLEEMSLITEAKKDDPNKEAVTMMTLHLAKGLEFPNVFIVGMEEGLFPSGTAVGSDEPDKIEEERRLAYVGMTRARENLFLALAKSRRVYGQEQSHPPSRFLGEIPDEFVSSNQPIKRPKFLDSMRGKSTNSWTPRGVDDDQDDFYSSGRNNRLKTAKPNNVFAFPNYENSSGQDSNNADDEFDSTPTKPADSFTKGMRVRHPIFGVGSIFQVEGSGDSQKVTVLFADQAVKKFLAKQARLVRV